MSTYERIVCFDLYKTLIAPVTSVDYTEVAAERLGASSESIKSFVREELITADLSSYEEMVSRLFAKFGRDRVRDSNAFDEVVAVWRSENNCVWIDGAAALVEELRVMPSTAVCLISNSPRPEWEALNSSLSLARKFHALHLPWQQRVAKPNKACWLGLLDRLKAEEIPPTQCWMVGDNKKDDIDVPKRMKWNTFRVKERGYIPKLRARLFPEAT